jgi:hypothetical protein
MSQQPDLLYVIANNTVGVLTVVPQHKEAWFKNVQQIRAQAQAAGDVPMVALLTAD